MENPKRYWCFSCNKECKIIKVIEDGDEVYQCSTCKNAFVEEMEEINNEAQSQNQQSQTQNNQTQSNTRINVTINNNNNININNNIANNTSQISNQNNPGQYQYGMNNTLLFLPSTVNYVTMNENNLIPSMMNSIGSIFSNISPEINNFFNSFNMNNGLISFLNNHNNDFQFNNLVNIMMSFDLGSNNRHPPASDKAIKELKKIEVNDNNLNNYKNITCNICLENFEVGNILRILECNHEFHENCIITWLKSNNTCPICRHELESNDPNYERRKNNHRENLRNLHRNNNNSNNNNNSGGGNSGMFV